MVMTTAWADNPRLTRPDKIFRSGKPGSILLATLEFLAPRTPPRRQIVKAFHFSRYFTVCETAVGTVGAAMSYYQARDKALITAEKIFNDLLTGCALEPACFSAIYRQLVSKLGKSIQPALLIYAAMTALVSAWSVDALKQARDDCFNTSRLQPEWTTGVQSVLVIGFGGMLTDMLRARHVRRVHVADLYCDARRSEIEAQCDAIRRRFPGKILTAGPAVTTRSDVDAFDCICISGSTLCNGTLEGLLALARPGTQIVIQGQSCAIYPKYLFLSGVCLVITSLKPHIIAKVVHGDYEGLSLVPYLEGHLPWIYITPNQKPLFSP